ncbi:MAG TPA: alpha/beta hydrolase [Steroidobacteraceae bacterium]
MPHITSEWAATYGLPDPASTAREIGSATTSIPADAARALRSVMLAARFSIEPTHAALAAVRAGWSAHEPRESLRAILDGIHSVEQDCHDLAQACADFATAISQADADVRTSYSAADGAIASMGLATPAWPGGIDEMLRIERERCALVWNLNAAVRAIARGLESAAATACAQLTVNPSATLRQVGPNPSQRRSDDTLATLREDLRGASGRQQHFASSIAAALARADAKGYRTQLLDYSSSFPRDQGSVAIALGDVSAATSVTILVPGVGNSPSDIADSFDLAHALNIATEKAAGDGSCSATVVWLGYDVPLSWAGDGSMNSWTASAGRTINDSVKAIDAAEASTGGDLLASFVRTLQPLMNSAASTTLIGHSYGATTVSQAARVLHKQDGVDDVVLLAAPGAGYGVAEADDYTAVDPDHIFSLSFPNDPIPGLGQSSVIAALNPISQNIRKTVFGTDPGPFGPNPATAKFGANVIDAPSNVPGDRKFDLDQHALSNYLSGPSLRSIAAVTATRYGQVPVRSPG